MLLEKQTHGLKNLKMNNQQIIDLFDLTISIMQPFTNIVAPLQNLGIRSFAYYKLLKNNKAFYICSDLAWNKAHYLSDKGFEGIIRSANECRISNVNKMLFCENPNKVIGTTKALFAPNKPMNANKMFEFNLWNSTSYYTLHEHYFESFNFFGGNDKPQLKHFYETKDNYLRKFISYFLVHFDPLLLDIDQKHWVEIKSEQLKVKKILKPDLLINSLDGIPIQLTEKQYDILYYFSQGKSLKNIDNALDISKSTAEKYLNRLKVKTGCTSTNDLM